MRNVCMIGLLEALLGSDISL